jgi:release factor glutamine methyltransferase
LKPYGKIFFEINEAIPGEVMEILKQHGYSEITPKKDINGKWRMVSAQKSPTHSQFSTLI